jgi:hypothetical protein
MAKKIAKPTTAKAAPKKVAAKAPAKSKSVDIEKVSKNILSKLKSLDLDQQLQSEIEWCLGSYSYDKNPTGLFETAERAMGIFKTEVARKTKGITAKFVADIEAALTK